MKKLLNIFVPIKRLFMGMKFGEVNSDQILENEFRIGVLENIIDLLIVRNPNLLQLTQEDLQSIRQRVTERLQSKYPNSGIKLNPMNNGTKK